ncbi:MAG: hypothetical protein QNJ46_01610 [Leptolyngbyaceae cyanobacterium MO_188.B28]|nr:hypothetical protein [Leptolyngbyaceae cyanobacterium MO_188.B28]
MDEEKEPFPGFRSAWVKSLGEGQHSSHRPNIAVIAGGNLLQVSVSLAASVEKPFRRSRRRIDDFWLRSLNEEEILLLEMPIAESSLRMS